MLKQELCHILNKELCVLYNIHEINNIANYFEAHLREMQNPEFLHSMDLKSEKWIYEWIEKLKTGEPIQYIAGSAPFLHLNLIVNKEVLIPRPETEELAHKIYLENKDFNSLKVLDIGAGSGCISLYLKSKKSDWDVSGIDFSKAAVDCAYQNAQRLQLNVTYSNSDFLNKNEWPVQKYDIIVSNPPYICASERAQMDKTVLQFEPFAALFAPGDDPLIFYKMIAEFGKLHLNDAACIYVELNEFLAKDIFIIFQNENYQNIEIECDFYNKPRFLKCKSLPE